MSTLHPFLNPENSPIYRSLQRLLPRETPVSEEDIHLAERLREMPDAQEILQRELGTNRTAEDILAHLESIVTKLPDVLSKLGVSDLLSRRSSKALVGLSLLLGLSACGEKLPTSTGMMSPNSYTPATAPAIVPNRLAELEAEVEALKLAHKESSTALKSEIDSARSSIEQTTGQLGKIASNLSSVTSIAQKAASDVSSVKTQQSNTSAALTQTMEELNRQNAMLGQVQLGLEGVSGSTSTLTSNLESTQMALKETQITANNLEEQMSATRLDNANLFGELQGLQQSVQSTRETVQGVQQTVVNESDRYRVNGNSAYLGYLSLYGDEGLRSVSIRFEHGNMGAPFMYTNSGNSSWQVPGILQADGTYLFTFPFEGQNVGNNMYSYGFSINTKDVDLFAGVPAEQSVLDVPYSVENATYSSGNTTNYYMHGVSKLRR